MAEYGVARISDLMPHRRLRPRAADPPRPWNTTQPSPTSATHIGKRLAGQLHEPFERAGGGRAIAPPLPTLQRRRPCNGAGAKGLRCSALATGQLGHCQVASGGREWAKPAALESGCRRNFGTSCQLQKAALRAMRYWLALRR